MPTIVIVLIACAVLWIGATLLTERGKKKLAGKGMLIQRDKKFMENAEIFTLKSISSDQLTDGLRKVNSETKVGITGDLKHGYRLDGGSWSKWSARLTCQQMDQAQSIFRFTFTEWKTDGGHAEDDISMNVVLTAVEKMFLGMDPNTQVQTVPVEYHTSHES